jgi:Na+/H+ antiporter NhaA
MEQNIKTTLFQAIEDEDEEAILTILNTLIYMAKQADLTASQFIDVLKSHDLDIGSELIGWINDRFSC